MEPIYRILLDHPGISPHERGGKLLGHSDCTALPTPIGKCLHKALAAGGQTSPRVNTPEGLTPVFYHMCLDTPKQVFRFHTWSRKGRVRPSFPAGRPSALLGGLRWEMSPQLDAEGQGSSLSLRKAPLAQTDTHQEQGEHKKQETQDNESHSIAGDEGVRLT